MYDEAISPALVLLKTLSHPIESVRVIGYEGRDKVYGRDAVVLKQDEMPRSEVGEGVKYGLSEKAVRLLEGGASLYVLAESAVYAASVDSSTDTFQHTFDTDYGAVTLQALTLESFTEFARSGVEVSLP